MKKRRVFAFALSLLLVVTILTGCESKTPNSTTQNNTLTDVLTYEYDLSELVSYIQGRNTNIYHHSLNDPERLLFYDELNDEFPIQVLTFENGSSDPAYTVYKVRQGGYYYVFWTHAYPNDEDFPDITTRDWTDTANMCVYFSTYINSPKSIVKFITLRVGKKTAADVVAIDPYCQFQALAATMRSMSIVSEKWVMQVTYTYDDLYNDVDFSYEHLIVKEIGMIPREKAGCFGGIIPEDLPF